MNLLINNIKQLVTVSANGKGIKAGSEMSDIGVVENSSVLIVDGKISKIAPSSKIKVDDEIFVLDAEGGIALPGFVDSHTHLIFSGSRENEFAMRAEGKTYQDIASSGGGILSTVRATREASKRELFRLGEKRLNDMLKLGTTTVEIKSGYGLSPDSEIKILEIINELKRDHFSTIAPTFLGAHAIPFEFKENPDEYVELICNYMLPHISEKKMAIFCDIFCENGYFNLKQSERILSKAKEVGLKIKLHADQLSTFGATELGVSLGAISVDHLELINENGINALSNSNTIATILPGSSFFLNHKYAPARTIIDSNIPVALATDFNPGTSMCYSMPMMMTIACTQMKMKVEEAITASTLNGAAALGLSNEVGSIEVGKNGDIIIFDVPDYKYIPYHFSKNFVKYVIKNGVLLEM
ncbi:MAG: imidazolonepropionase [Ignavibacteria bacterium]|nr:imidazolonepropionase [Ignavibacteria bacterium]